MLLAYESDTIAAIATPAGEGGISVIRISGEDAFKIADRGFRGKTSLAKTSSHTAHYGSFVDEQGRAIDNVVAIVFRKPHSYTGEDTVELNCHGGQFLARTILEATIRYGARAAQAGEFTKRAFLNGQLDLAQAEAVADLIHARSERAHQSSLAQLNGFLSKKITEIRDQLVSGIGLLELELDFAEDGYEFTERSKVSSQLQAAISQIDALLGTYRAGKVYRDGVKVVLAGAPNVGKSSLLNALLQEDRAIVTSIPGTTRDVIEESITLGGLLFTLSDTAGLRETLDPIEQEGVRRTEERLSNCDILILMLESSRLLGDAEARAAQKLTSSLEAKGTSCLIAVNKIDLTTPDRRSFAKLGDVLSKHRVLEVSAKTHEGLERLKEALVEVALEGSAVSAEGNVTITNARHFSALERAKQSLVLALDTQVAGKSGEFVAVDLRAGLDALGEIIGATSTEDILNSIFARFCIGK